ncbi:hypothetical protein [Salmonella enterica]|uniref:hypothetical protein n=1 Tax=Salmonella enterica TaxID=28901 RepID=UPI0009AFB318|nr:hypothetical protein [Salmonella enterica]
MIDKRTASAIDMSFRKTSQPVYVVVRHGDVKRCFSRNTALRCLAKFMTKEVFRRAGIPVEYAPVREIHLEGEVWVTQGLTDEFQRAHQRCVRRLRRILARKRDMQKWSKKYDAWVAQHDELMKQKPY